jgi:hypothetical protein
MASAWAEDSCMEALEALGAGERMLGGRKGELGVNVSLAGEDCGKSDMVECHLFSTEGREKQRVAVAERKEKTKRKGMHLAAAGARVWGA